MSLRRGNRYPRSLAEKVSIVVYSLLSGDEVTLNKQTFRWKNNHLQRRGKGERDWFSTLDNLSTLVARTGVATTEEIERVVDTLILNAKGGKTLVGRIVELTDPEP